MNQFSRKRVHLFTVFAVRCFAAMNGLPTPNSRDDETKDEDEDDSTQNYPPETIHKIL